MSSYDVWLTTDVAEEEWDLERQTIEYVCVGCKANYKCKWYRNDTERECPLVKEELEWEPDPEGDDYD